MGSRDSDFEAQVELFELTQSLAQIGVWTLDTETNAVTWTDELNRIAGRRADALPMTVEGIKALIHPDDVAVATASIESAVRGDPVEPWTMRWVRPDGELRWVETRARLNRPGQLVGVVQDVTERVATQHELEASQARADIAQAIGHFAAIEMDLAAGTVTWSPEMWRITGRDPGSFSPSDDAFNAIHPLDQAKVIANTEDLVTGRGEHPVEFRIIRPDGALRWLKSHGRLVGDHKIIGFVHDITEIRALDEERQLHTRILELMNEAVALVGGTPPRYFYVNPRFAADVGLTPEEVLETSPENFLQDPSVIDEMTAAIVRDGRWEGDVRGQHSDGAELISHMSLTSMNLVDSGLVTLVVSADVTEQRRQEEELRRSEEQQRRYAERLQEANEAKTSFMSRMSHELRTPLNAVLGYSQLLALADLDQADHESVEQILSAGRHLLGLIDEVLDITTVEAGNLRLVLEPVDITAVIEDSVQLVQPMAASHRVTIATPTSSPATTDSPAFADAQRVTQILLNLLSNAIKYNRPGGGITVTTETHGDRITLAVIDTGHGIPADALARVFDPFDRLGADRLGIEGTGIGLSLARTLAERMDGTLTVSSEPGRGSTFTLELPTRPAATSAGAEVDGGDRSPPVATPSDRPLRIVHIEDNPTNQRLIEAALQRRPNIELHTAATGADGLSMAADRRPDLVLLDLHLPDMAGADVLQQLKASDVSPPAVIVVSADANLEQINATIALGADDYLTKPIHLDALYAVIERLADDRPA